MENYILGTINGLILSWVIFTIFMFRRKIKQDKKFSKISNSRIEQCKLKRVISR